MNQGHDPVAIANYFIGLYELDKKNSGEGLDLMQLLKLSYLAHGFKLGITGHPLSNENLEAWRYGPVFPSIYQAFKLGTN